MKCFSTGEADNCRVDITDPSLESIELSEMAKPDEGCVVLGRRLLYADSCRAQRHRSYKVTPILLRRKRLDKKRSLEKHEQKMLVKEVNCMILDKIALCLVDLVSYIVLLSIMNLPPESYMRIQRR